jgi:hypothetical protein
MRNIDQLAAVGAVSAVLFAGAAQPAMANCDPHARQQFIENQVISDAHFSSLVLKAPHPDTTEVVVSEAHQPGNFIVNPGVIKCGKHIVDYFGLKVEYFGSETDISTALLPAAKAKVSEQTDGNHNTSIKNPQQAGLLVRRTLRAQFDDVYGPIGFTDGNLTFGLML